MIDKRGIEKTLWMSTFLSLLFHPGKALKTCELQYIIWKTVKYIGIAAAATNVQS